MTNAARIAFAFAMILLAGGQLSAQQDAAPDSVLHYGLTDGSSIAGGVVIPPGRAVVWTSGTGPPLFNDRAAPGTRERFGDTKIQAEGALRRVEQQLGDLGLSLADVVYVRAYLVPDEQLGGIDSAGWNEAFGEFFGTPANPARPARSTIGVSALANPDWLIEVEAFAVYPE